MKYQETKLQTFCTAKEQSESTRAKLQKIRAKLQEFLAHRVWFSQCFTNVGSLYGRVGSVILEPQT